MLERKEKKMEKVSMNKLEMARRAAKGGSGGTIAPATSETLGGVKIGAGVNIASDGTISVPSYTPPAYSTVEHNTGRKWIDGKDIFEKVVVFDSPLTVSRDGSNTGIMPFHDTMISAKGSASNGSCICFMEFVQDDTIHLACSNDFAVDSIIFEYTKAGA